LRVPWAQLAARAREGDARFVLRLEESLASLKQRNPGTARYLEL
jgi:hypothetical protein